VTFATRLSDAIAFHVELARERASRYVPRHSRSYVIEKWTGWSWQWHETRSSLADAIARIDAFPWFARRIVCEGVPLGEVGAGSKWFGDAA